MPFAQADDGTRIGYESHGTGSLKVLLLHGWGRIIILLQTT
jgi:hypothetical protein